MAPFSSALSLFMTQLEAGLLNLNSLGECSETEDWIWLDSNKQTWQCFLPLPGEIWKFQQMRWSVLGRNNRKRKFRDRTHHPAPKVKKLTRHKFLCQLQTRLRHHHQTYKFYILSLFINRQQLAMFRSLNQWKKPNKSVNGKLWDCSIQYLHLRGVSTMSGEHILNLFQRWSLSYKYPKCFPPSFIGLLQTKTLCGLQ